MKRVKILIFMLIFALFTQVVFADEISDETMQQAIRLLGIMNGDQNGNLNLNNKVTRAEFCKMTVKASAFRNSSTGINTSLFKDVKYTFWGAGYINIAINQGWIMGYSDGTFRPDSNIKLEEAATILLRALGYTNDELAGPYPQTQLNKFVAMGLNKNIDKKQGQILSRRDCMNLFYNLMNCTTKDGTIYATTLGYIVDSNNKLDFNELLVKNMSNPIVAYGSEWKNSVPFDTDKAIIYKNGELSSINSIEQYDVVYYNSEINCIWVYSSKKIGIYSQATPNTASPKEVTVAGNQYTVATTTAKQKLSSMGQYNYGDMVAIILDINGQIIDVVDVDKFENVSCGVVIEKVNSKITVVCTDSSEQSFDVGSKYFAKGDIVRINYENNKTVVEKVTKQNNFMNYKIDENAQIIDINSIGEYTALYKNRLEGVNLADDDVLYFSLNSSNKIDKLILNDVSGDLYDYGILVDKAEENDDFALSGSYQFVINGELKYFTTSDSVLNASVGPSIIRCKNTDIANVKLLSSCTLVSISPAYTYAYSNIQKHNIEQNAQIYIYANGTYIKASLEEINDFSKYSLTGYYDSSFKIGNGLRIIIAKLK